MSKRYGIYGAILLLLAAFNAWYWWPGAPGSDSPTTGRESGLPSAMELFRVEDFRLHAANEWSSAAPRPKRNIFQPRPAPPAAEAEPVPVVEAEPVPVVPVVEEPPLVQEQELALVEEEELPLVEEEPIARVAPPEEPPPLELEEVPPASAAVGTAPAAEADAPKEPELDPEQQAAIERARLEQKQFDAAMEEIAQIRLVGVLLVEGKAQAFVKKGEALYVVARGEAIDDHFIVEEITLDTIYLTDTNSAAFGHIPISGQ